MALTTIKAATVARATLWQDPETLEQFQIITVWEKYLNGRHEPKNRKWTLWHSGAILDLGEGDILDVTGDLGTKTETWTKDGTENLVVGHSIHSPSISNHDTSKRRGGELLGRDQDDIRKYGHPVYGSTNPADDTPF